MNKKLNYIFFAVIIIFSITSCRKSLDVSNPNGPDETNFWKTGNDALLGVNAIYGNNYRNGLYARWFALHFNPRSDDGWGSSGWDQIYTVTNFLTTNYDAEPINHTWAHLYRGIYRTNQVLAYVPPIQMDETLKKQYLAEAKFWRATYNFNLVVLWGNVPLILHPSIPTDLPFQSKPEEVYAQIELDLNEAIPDLPTSYDDQNIGRITRGAAYAMLGKVYMQQHKWQQAHDALQWLVEGPGASLYDLVANYSDNFSTTAENNIESVLEINFKAQQSVTDEDDPNSNLGNQREPFFAPGTHGIGFNDLEMHRWVIYEFEKEKTASGGVDPRLAETAIFDSTDERGPYYSKFWGYTFAQLLSPTDKRCWYRKYENDKGVYQGFEGEKNFRVIRYADVLLMYAECLNQLNQTSNAYQYVDRVRQRAGLAKLSDIKPGMTQAQFQNQLEHERITELTGEDLRWFDLARWGYLDDPSKIAELAARDFEFQNFNPNKKYLPIPQSEIDINPNLQQNPGWQ